MDKTLDNVKNTRDINELEWRERWTNGVNGSFNFDGPDSYKIGQSFLEWCDTQKTENTYCKSMRMDYSQYPVFEKKINKEKKNEEYNL